MGRAGSLLLDNRRLLGRLLVVTVLMFGFGYALVPLYRAICKALGVNVLSLAEQNQKSGTWGPSGISGIWDEWFGAGKRTAAAATGANSQVDLSRTITVEFDANARGPWDFKPALRSLQVHPGELSTVMYEFTNVQNRTMAAQAIPSYAPMQAGAFFNKVECFCFNEYILAPGESRRWPVTFVLDPKLPRDVTTITLSYTFFEVGGKVPAAPASPKGKGGA